MIKQCRDPLLRGKDKESRLEQDVYSPSQSPLHLDEHGVAEQLVQMRNEGNIIVSNDELQEGMLEAPKEIAMDLTIA